MASKFALIIANTEYTDPGLSQLTAPGQDARAFWSVLDSPELGAFDDVIILLNENESKVRETIDYFFSLKKPDDLLLMYFSGHGIRDEYGSLYLAVKNTNRDRLRSTAVKTDFIREAMDQSRSRRQVLILDCCNSGAFAQGTKAETGGSMGTATAFQGTGFGRVVLTASDATQFAWEGDQIIGETQTSLFTHFLVKGLEGEADTDGDGRITVDELYDYAYEKIVTLTPKQTPGKWSYKQQGEIILRDNLNPSEAGPTPLPPDLIELLSHSNASVRKTGMQDLISLLDGKHLGMALSAEQKLGEIAANDDSLVLRKAAGDSLIAHGLGFERRATVGTVPEKEIVEEAVEQPVVVQPRELPQQKKAASGLNLRLIGGIAGGLLILSLLIWGGSRAFMKAPAATPDTTLTVEVSATFTSQAVVEVISQPTSTDTPPPMETSIPPTPTLGIGAFRISEKDNMTLLYVPAGEFTMGSDDGQPDERPAHQVYLDAFWIDQTEVTNRMYILCVGENACKEPQTIDSSKNFGYYGGLAFNNFPVINVDWNMAATYCDWADRRLPTEAEWEKAARSPDGSLYPWGDEAPNGNLLNFNGNVGDTSGVKSYEAGKSVYGAYDMSGNVWEWVNDWYSETYYQNSPPTSQPPGPESGISRVHRGGSFLDGANLIYSSKRDKGDPVWPSLNLGFRCAISATPP